MSEATVSSNDTRPEWVAPLRDVGRFVDGKIGGLQQGLGRSSQVTATLAHLRHAVGKPAGSVPTIWTVTVDGVPGRPEKDEDEPTVQERAVHAALTLYALHQQSRSDRMHKRGQGFGQAVRVLGDRAGASNAVRRRFDAVATATSFDEMTHHMRGLVTQLRGANVQLDYGQLADDLVAAQRDGGMDIVRRRWGRQYYRLTRADQDTDGNAAAVVDRNDDIEEQS